MSLTDQIEQYRIRDRKAALKSKWVGGTLMTIKTELIMYAEHNEAEAKFKEGNELVYIGCRTHLDVNVLENRLIDRFGTKNGVFRYFKGSDGLIYYSGKPWIYDYFKH